MTSHSSLVTFHLVTMSTPPQCGTELLLLMLSQLHGLGPARINALIDRFGADASLLEAGPDTFVKIHGIGRSLACELAETLCNCSWRQLAQEKAEKQFELSRRLGATILPITDPRYPELLRQIHDPPPLLFVRGDPSVLAYPSIAIVGTRRATPYGQRTTDFFSRDLAASGHAIVSGLAYGIDMTAHRATVECGGITIAVLGCGIDTIYTDPAGRLWPKILERGAIVSEEWIGSEPLPGNFPKRNRLIAGMTLGTLIIESDVKGGAMITASFALEQNREVFAVPGNIFSKASRGPHQLISESRAKPVFSVADLLAELQPLACSSRPSSAGNFRAATPSGFTREELRILSILGEEPVHIDQLAERSGTSIDTLLVLLFDLELKQGLVQEPGQLFRRGPAAPVP